MAFWNNLFRTKSVTDALHSADIESEQGQGLQKNLRVMDLTALGIAAIIGAGIFSTIGRASYEGGPGVVFLFIFTAVACGFAALAYAEFASLIPVSGSAYTYSYVAFGELIAWIIGWALIMEYAVGNITVAVSWSGYFTGLLEGFGVHFPAWSHIDYVSAQNGFKDATEAIRNGETLESLSKGTRDAHAAWTSAPQLGGLRVIADIPAIVMSILITGLVYIGIKESKTASNIMVALKLLVVMAVIGVGMFFINGNNWTPFLPNGIGGVLGGVSSVFFAYIGFDALSTTAEECKNPQRDLPKAMIWSIIICTILYILIALVITGMVNYKLLDVDDPLAFAFAELSQNASAATKGFLSNFSLLIAISAVIAMAGVFLVFQLGQPRIWMAMSRDGLLPKPFGRIHPKFRTPAFATIITGFFVVVPMLFIPSDTVLDLCSMGTLFAFVLVCAGVLKMQITPNAPRGKFKTPYINGQILFPLLVVLSVAALFYFVPKETKGFLTNEKTMYAAPDLVGALDDASLLQLESALVRQDSAGMAAAKNKAGVYLAGIPDSLYAGRVMQLPLTEDQKFESGWSLFKHKIPMWLFILTTLALCFWSIRHKLSLIPVLGLVFCFYMMAQIPAKSWWGFLVWLVIGLFIYFGYGYSNSKIGRNKMPQRTHAQ